MGLFDISGDTVKQAEAAANFLLIIPENAKVDKSGDAAWTEHGRIIEAWSESFERDYEGKKCEVSVLAVKVEIDGNENGSGKNVGGTFKSTLRMNGYALQNGKNRDKGSPLRGQYTMTNMSIHRMKAMLRACGVQPDMEDGGYSVNLQLECFPPQDSFSGVPSPLIGCSFLFEIKKHESVGEKDKKLYTNYEIAQVLE